MVRKAAKPARSDDPVLFAVLAIALLARTYHFGYPFWDYFASRQTFNLLVVRAYLHNGIDLFRPTLDWLALADPSRPSYFCGEFPWLHALAAVEMRLLPFGDWCTRLIPVAFSLAGLWWIYGLTRRVIGQPAARFAALAWAVVPFSVFFGRAFMSDVPALSLAAGSLNAFCAWLETRRPIHFLGFVLPGSLALLTKPQVAAFGLAAAYLAFSEFGWQTLKQWRLYIAALVLPVPAILWVHHTGELSRAGAPPVIGVGMIGRSLHLWLRMSSWSEQWHRMFFPVLGPVALGLTVLGLLWPLRIARHYLFHVWFLATALFLFLIPEAIVGWNDYYLLLLVPASSGLIGIALGKLYEVRTTRTAVLLLSVALAASSFIAARPLFRSDELHYHAGLLLNRLTSPNDLIATSAGGAPDPLYFSERRGWESNRYSLSILEGLSAAGARILAMSDPDAIRNNIALAPLLDRRFLRLTPNDLAPWTVWSLDPADLNPDRSRPEKARAGTIVDFGGQIGLQRAAVRELLIWPASFEVRSDWQCLHKVGANLRVFVHVTRPDGQTIFQQDHWPLGGRLPTTQWNVGDTIRERYVMVLPREIDPGPYQLRVGWFDPAKGARLPLVAGGAADHADRATVAEIQVQRKPESGWFSAEE